MIRKLNSIYKVDWTNKHNFLLKHRKLCNLILSIPANFIAVTTVTQGAICGIRKVQKLKKELQNLLSDFKFLSPAFYTKNQLQVKLMTESFLCIYSWPSTFQKSVYIQLRADTSSKLVRLYTRGVRFILALHKIFPYCPKS